MDKITYNKTLDAHKNGIQFTLQGFETADNMSRRIEISLMASGDTYDLPLEGVEALMYITTPSAKEPSIAECTIKDNVIAYDVLPIVEAGITEMQLKVIGTSVNGAKSVLVSPRFAVEVLESNTDDTEAEKSTTFTALEDAVAKASAAYEARLLRIEVDENCVFRAFYADGTVYESTSIRDSIVAISTDADLEALVRDAVEDLAVDEVIDQFSERKLFGTAVYSEDLAAAYENPTLIRWDAKTFNTPYKAAITSVSDGFAICYGNTLNHTAVAWATGGSDASTYIRRTIGGVVKDWQAYLTEQGGAIDGILELRDKLVLSDSGEIKKNAATGAVSIKSKGSEDGGNSLEIAPETAALEEAVKLLRSIGGTEEEYKLYGEHNVPYPAQIYVGTYTGSGEGENAYNKTISFPIRPMVVYLANHLAVRPADSAFRFRPTIVERADVIWGDKEITFNRVTGTAGSGTKFNVSGTKYNYVVIGN